MDAVDIELTRRRLEEGSGGYEIVHSSPGLEIGVYVFGADVAGEPHVAVDRVVREEPQVPAGQTLDESSGLGLRDVIGPAGNQATAMLKAAKDLGLREAGINVVSTQDLVPDEELLSRI